MQAACRAARAHARMPEHPRGGQALSWGALAHGDMPWARWPAQCEGGEGRASGVWLSDPATSRPYKRRSAAPVTATTATRRGAQQVLGAMTSALRVGAFSTSHAAVASRRATACSGLLAPLSAAGTRTHGLFPSASSSLQRHAVVAPQHKRRWAHTRGTAVITQARVGRACVAGGAASRLGALSACLQRRGEQSACCSVPGTDRSGVSFLWSPGRLWAWRPWRPPGAHPCLPTCTASASCARSG